MDFKKNLGKKIVMARKAAGMSQFDLAVKINSSQQALSAYERGSVAISVELLSKICDILDAPISWFMPNVKQYGEIISEADVELLNELHKLSDSETLLNVVRVLRKQSGVKKSRRLVN